MTKASFFRSGALGVLATALLASALPAEAQTGYRGHGGRGQHEARAQNHEDRARSPRQSQPTASARNDWGGDREQQREAGRSQAYARQAAAPQARVDGRVAVPSRNTTYTAPRDRSYGAYSRSGGWQGQQQQARGVGASNQPVAGQPWARSGDRQADSRRENARENDRRADRRQDARREEWRDDRRNYGQGYRDGRRADNRYRNDYRHWDNRGWRNDNRYNWYRYRASNRSLYRLGRYYAPYRGYNYSRISIGFRLGSLFYSNRYWINDPWQYRLPEVYGPYRWIRYYNDALLVDIYSGEVVDAINNFFW